jgi:DNA-binding beta-propeller fold protein YncE
MDGSTIDVIDLATDRVMQTFDFGHGVRPTALSSDQPMDYSTSQRS